MWPHETFLALSRCCSRFCFCFTAWNCSSITVRILLIPGLIWVCLWIDIIEKVKPYRTKYWLCERNIPKSRRIPSRHCSEYPGKMPFGFRICSSWCMRYPRFGRVLSCKPFLTRLSPYRKFKRLEKDSCRMHITKEAFKISHGCMSMAPVQYRLFIRRQNHDLGAFAQVLFDSGDVNAPLPLIHLPNQHVLDILDMYTTTYTCIQQQQQTTHSHNEIIYKQECVIIATRVIITTRVIY